MKSERQNVSWLPLLPAAVFLVLGEWLVRTDYLPRYLVPAPSDVFQTFVADSSELWSACLSTLISSASGLALSLSMGLLLGIILSSSRFVQKAFYPYAIFFQTVPIIAIAPLLVIWIGFGRPTVIASTFIVSVFPMIASTLSGLQSTDVNLTDLFKLYRASRFDSLFKLRLPYALPQIFVGVRISAGLSVIGAIVGEFIAGGGLGGIIDVARTRQRVDVIFAALILASLIGLAFVQATNATSRRALRHWHPSEGEN